MLREVKVANLTVLGLGMRGYLSPMLNVWPVQRNSNNNNENKDNSSTHNSSNRMN